MSSQVQILCSFLALPDAYYDDTTGFVYTSLSLEGTTYYFELNNFGAIFGDKTLNFHLRPCYIIYPKAKFFIITYKSASYTLYKTPIKLSISMAFVMYVFAFGLVSISSSSWRVETA